MKQYKSEVWRDVKGFEGFYRVSNYGNVRSLDKVLSQDQNGILYEAGSTIKPQRRGDYVAVKLSVGAEVRKLHSVHRIVAMAFLPNPDNLPEVNHIDGNKLNNNLSNLEWCSRAYNYRHAREVLKNTYSGERHHSAKLTEQDVADIKHKFSVDYYTFAQLAREYSVSESTVSNIVKGKKWQHLKQAEDLVPIMDGEEWRLVVGWEGRYMVSNLGRIKSVIQFKGCSIKRHKVLATRPWRNGYVVAALRRPGVKQYKSVHRLVAEAFLPNPDSLPVVNHKNGKKDDNRLENLEWVNHSENALHAFRVLGVRKSA